MVPDNISAEVLLFCVTAVTLVPITTPTVTEPEPEPLLVMVPVLLRLPVKKLMAPSVVVLLLNTKLPVPVAPPVIEIVPALFVMVVAVALGLIAPLIVNADVLLF